MEIKKKINEWYYELKQHKYKIILSLLLLGIATFISQRSANYADKVAAPYATPDLFLSLIPVMNLNFLFIYGYILVLAILCIYPLFFSVKKFHEMIYHFSLIVIVRALFITLTHLKAPDGAIPSFFPWPFNNLSFQNDLFFSGHVATTLIGFFIFKGEKIRYFFLISSIIFAFTVLAMRQHYSIDVFAAFFITYGTYKIGNAITKKFSDLKIKYF